MSLLLLALALAAGDPEPVVAEVNGEAITVARFRARLAMLRAQRTEATPAAAMERLVDDVLGAGEARRQGLHRDPAVAAEVEAQRNRLAADLLLARNVGNLLPSEEDLRGLYHQASDSMRVRHAVFATEEEAQAALGRARKEGGLLAGAKGALALRAGDRPQTRMDLDPALAAAALSAPLNSPQGPLRIANGFAVFEVLERSVADEAGFPARREALLAFAAEQLQKQARAHLVEQLRRKAGAKVDEAFLQKMGSRLDATPEEAAHPVAQAGGRTLRYAEVLEDARGLARGQSSSHMSGPRIKVELARRRLDAMLLENEAVARGLGQDPAIQPALWQYEQAVLAQFLDARTRAATPEPGPAEVEAHYAAHAAEYAGPGKRSCAHILYDTRAQAEGARKRLAGGASFEALARGESVDTASGKKGGILGDVGDDRIDAMLGANSEAELARAIRETPAGEVSEPVKSGLGFHLLRCGPRQPPTARPLAEVRGAVIQRLRSERAQRAAETQAARLRSAARTRIDEQALAKAAVATEP